MRVAYVCADPGVPVFGTKGSSVHVQAVLRALLRRGLEVTLFASRFDGPLPADLAAVTCVPLPLPPKGATRIREAALLAANEDLAAALDRSGPFDLVYERYSLWSYAAMGYAQRTGVPGVLEVNAPLIDEQIRHRELINRAGAMQVAQRLFRTATALLAVSQEVAAYLRTFAGEASIVVVPNGVDPDRFPVGSRPVSDATYTVGFVGTLKPWHGLEVLLAAFAQLHQRLPPARLLLVGDGPERGKLEAQVNASGLAPVVEFTGAVSPEAIPGLLARMDVATAPYPSRERCYFSPLKLFEYLAAGLPVVASQVGQVADILTHGETGLLCPPGDPEALMHALVALHDSPALRVKLGAAGRQLVLDHYTWDAVAGRILAVAQGQLVAQEWASYA
ncbi:glycosyltransferase family 4 protein [Candidatus Chloroploca asiatica]|uniref:Glycosyl transferase family 1 n=1 Tax=Candidatus Chloroploca asiatica TaxID=1506545 RepID=A0A2H3KHP5_9CHLR|nr:glycosyltransferase family 4 protein [Candidatus Chloroploca asiatica]PDV97325.1 glycosyl transferase family 1 [Candidatus Chloroploca asiatica]